MIKPAESKTIRCAIYTRKSTEDGLEQEFNSLDAQREAAEAYIKSQKQEGWGCLPNSYDDGGFTGANMDRPALRRLIADISAGKIDAVVVYKVDRLSRSLLDFSRIVETFDKHKVSFVSVTQQFNTGSSMGRLVLNVLLSFAQFEREMISERTRDKIAAARRKGKWSGGMPVLGYTVENTKLIVDELEAGRVRQIFQMYLARQSALSVAKELNARGWRTKDWLTQKGIRRGGQQFDKNAVYKLLSNVVYVGKVRYKTEVHKGEHEAIIDTETFEKVQKLLVHNGRTGGRTIRNRHHALLSGILQCKACRCNMNHSYSKKGAKLYRYYVCDRAQKHGWGECPNPSLPANEIERFVIEQIKCVGRDPALVRTTLAKTRQHAESEIERLQAERALTLRTVRDEYAHVGELAAKALDGDPRLAESQVRIRDTERRVTEIEDELAKLGECMVDENEVAETLREFDQLWEVLSPKERSRVVELIVERVTYDGTAGKLAITYRPTGIRELAIEIAQRTMDAA